MASPGPERIVEQDGSGHRRIVAALLVVATLIAFLAVFSIWVNRQALTPRRPGPITGSPVQTRAAALSAHMGSQARPGTGPSASGSGRRNKGPTFGDSISAESAATCLAKAIEPTTSLDSRTFRPQLFCSKQVGSLHGRGEKGAAMLGRRQTV
jgi:hypothetical protein